jgi:V/A-type H+-transporting ATPase subunit C
MEAFNITQFTGDTRYGSVVAKLRVMENRFLTRQKLIRMAEREDWMGVLDELQATDYHEDLVRVRTAEELETALFQSIRTKYRFVHELSLRPEAFKAMQYWHDFHNLKLLLFPDLSSSMREFPLSPLGNFPPELLQEHVEEKRKPPDPLGEFYSLVTSDYDEYRSPFRTEMLLERCYFNEVRRIFEESGIPFLIHFITYRIDLIRILQILRWRHGIEKAGSNGQEAPIDWELLPRGGLLGQEKLEALASAPWEKLPALLRYTPYGKIFQEGMDTFYRTGGLWHLERLAEDFVTDFCNLSRYTPFGVEPLVSFLWISRQELKNLTMIVTTKYVGLDPEMIKARLRITHA